MWEMDLVTFANALAEAVGGSVVIFSPQQDVLAASRLGPADDAMRRQAVLDQHGPVAYRQRLRERGVYRRLWGTDEVLEVEPVPELGAGRRLAVAVRAAGRDGEILGSVWVAERPPGLHDQAADTLAGSIRAARELLLWSRARAFTRRFTEDVTRQLLTGEADVDDAASRLDVDPNLPCAVACCAVAGSSDEHRLAELLAVQLGTYRSTMLPVASRGRVDVLLCELGDPDRSGLSGVLETVGRQGTRALGGQVLIGVGAVVPRLADVRRSREEAALVLRVLRQRGSGPALASLDEVRASAELLLLADLVASRPELREGPVATLVAYDVEHRTSFVESLRAYLDAFGDIAHAARTLNVHPNTLRYRLRRIPEVCGLDLADPDERLMAAVQLRVSA